MLAKHNVAAGGQIPPQTVDRMALRRGDKQWQLGGLRLLRQPPAIPAERQYSPPYAAALLFAEIYPSIF